MKPSKIYWMLRAWGLQNDFVAPNCLAQCDFSKDKDDSIKQCDEHNIKASIYQD